MAIVRFPIINNSDKDDDDFIGIVTAANTECGVLP